MPDRLTYLASPYTATREIRPGDVRPDLDLQGYRAVTAAACAARMMGRGELVYSPIAHGHALATACVRGIGTDWKTWAAHSLRMIRACDEVAVLVIPGWRESKGVQAEIAEARRLGMPVRFVDATGEPWPARKIPCPTCGGAGRRECTAATGEPCPEPSGHPGEKCADRCDLPCKVCGWTGVVETTEPRD